MAVRTPFAVAVAKGVLRVTWSGLQTTDTGAPFSFGAQYTDKTVSVFGTYGAGATVSITGTGDPAGTPASFTKLNDSRGEGNPLDFLTAGGNDSRVILENPFWIAVASAGGDGTTALTVVIDASNNRR